MNRIRRWGMKITLLAIVLLVPLILRAELLDRIVATVNNEVITASELKCSIALDLRLDNTDKDQCDREENVLDSLINRQLLVQEAHRLKFVEISEQELNAEVEKFRDRFASNKEFNDFLVAADTTRRELARILGERLLVERFVEKKVGLFVRVSREEAQDYFDKHASEFKNKRFPDVQKSILALLTEQELRQQLGQYLEELRGKADIRIRL